jgi:hypothetical protein
MSTEPVQSCPGTRGWRDDDFEFPQVLSKAPSVESAPEKFPDDIELDDCQHCTTPESPEIYYIKPNSLDISAVAHHSVGRKSQDDIETPLYRVTTSI